ncbi:TetR/AcrR family transcriptional regulator [Nocardia huaxiensis]|uniref:TetR/AcrR family transcriptional regulator n=1 Tax=Nocardia huaxiensis TaxID=2755382 RepID=A0A7D6VN36_9NOCA|nr:TetR/AcrR family transcriptional regulator [Nocardia huaxiensis]QLY33390.1 TetR/AcrR family transcriptional regulator [Nocardia huaxiensis]UFS99694.1 TetR/AcrR family transcriptional regulator [Nocardia huaxiensis]
MGRPRQFDESSLLDAATELFWSQGFDNTSVEDVSRATGVGNGSIYGAYANKRGLFLAAFERYCDHRARFIRDTILSAPGSTRAAVEALLEAVIDDCTSHPDRRGCLMLNSIAQLGHRIPEVITLSARTTTAMEQAVAERLRRAGVDDSTLGARSAAIIAMAQGLIHSSRLGIPRDQLFGTARVSAAALTPAEGGAAAARETTVRKPSPRQ